MNIAKCWECLYDAESNWCRSIKSDCNIPGGLKWPYIFVVLAHFRLCAQVCSSWRNMSCYFLRFSFSHLSSRAEGPRLVSPLECSWGCRRLRKWALLMWYSNLENLVPTFPSITTFVPDPEEMLPEPEGGIRYRGIRIWKGRQTCQPCVPQNTTPLLLCIKK